MTTSTTILTQQTHPGNGETITVTGDMFKGDGFYGRSDGLHSIQCSVDGLSGSVYIQATLAVEPLEEDWFTVYTYTVINQTDSVIQNFTGNYVWVRPKLIYTNGSVTSITMNN